MVPATERILAGSDDGPPSVDSVGWTLPQMRQSLLVFVLGCCALAPLLLVPDRTRATPTALRFRGLGEVTQHVYIVRHGDKYSSYPDCGRTQEQPCFDAALMGDNPPLTECGIKQAEHTASWLQNDSASRGGIQSIVVSPYTRTLQTALPLAVALDKKLKVEYLLSEANQPEGPHREYNINEPAPTVEQLQKIHGLWDVSYGSPPIPTPENNTLYVKRVVAAAAALRRRFPPDSGNIAVYTHATTSFSVAYGLCYGNSTKSKLQEFVEGQDAIAPAGVIHIAISSSGECIKIDQTQNVADEVRCGKTEPYKCPFADFPSWYWFDEQGKGPGKCH